MDGVRQILAALKGALTWWITVAPWEQAIRVRLGKKVTLLGPGIHLRLPVLDRIYLQSVRTRVSTMPAQTLVTKDGKALTVAVTVSYRISDLLLLYQTLHHAEGTISNMILGAVGEFVVSRDIIDCHPALLGPAVSLMADLGQYGISNVKVTVMTFAVVKTYRFISGDGHGWNHGATLDTNTETRPGDGGLY